MWRTSRGSKWGQVNWWRISCEELIETREVPFFNSFGTPLSRFLPRWFLAEISRPGLAAHRLEPLSDTSTKFQWKQHLLALPMKPEISFAKGADWFRLQDSRFRLPRG